VVTLGTTVIITAVTAWVVNHSVPEGTTFYDFMEDRSLLQAKFKHYDLLLLNYLALLAMLIVGVYQLITRLFLKGIINILLALLLVLPVLLIPFGVLAALNECQSLAVCGNVSDESALRYEFNLPDEVELIELYSPTGSSFFGREGLTIDATFRFTHAQFHRYLTEHVHVDMGWKKLPIPRDLLWHIGDIEGSVEREIQLENSLNESLIEQGEEPPPPRYAEEQLRPTEEERFQRFLQQFPAFPVVGYYTCRTAGTNVLYATKTSCDKPDYVNDFILATLDTTTLELWIKVRSYY
jgi:hypothetical protein